ncbi:TadE/TadG family type IV pilus assembly protein [Paraburkholderia caribensis]|uniref:TadE/TadG family type IV pilus assembly protein n=1 Tax=Paraburkholderia caribensis TaxID=75105 RepID=UPI000721369C|nr:TadE/TadG family type IV pilus assembly protein [Paraburkholderia caribensis]ALP66350.1 pilus assembly protein TadE [Paraburkholderia caribensis]AUT54715.1 pilus assembly protein [Paraburkholderia caribensis]
MTTTRPHLRAPRASRSQPCRRRQRGVATLEFAFIAPVLFFLLCMVMDLGVALWVNLTMQYAVREGARYAVTGQTGLDPNQKSPQRYLAVIQEIKDQSMGLYPLVNPSYAITINSGKAQSYASDASYTSSMFGNPGDIVVLQINCAWPMITPMIRSFFPGGFFNFSVAATMRNEGF